MLLVLLICTDLVTGILKAIVKKDLASREMLVGIVRKLLIMVCVCIGFEVNAALLEYAKEAGVSYNWDIRMFVILYFILEELLSVLENIAVIGVPMPKFIIQFLRVVVDTATNSTPNKIIELFNKIRKGNWGDIITAVGSKEDSDKKEIENLANKSDNKNQSES
jgi:toxin secretion/phage lysis holin